MWIGHRKEIQKLTFRALALRRSKSRNYELCVVYIQKYGATGNVKKQLNKLVEWKPFVNAVRIKSADLKLLILTALTNAFHSTNLFSRFSRYQQEPTNSVAPYFCI